jgi:hypothetical protein
MVLDHQDGDVGAERGIAPGRRVNDGDAGRGAT